MQLQNVCNVIKAFGGDSDSTVACATSVGIYGGLPVADVSQRLASARQALQTLKDRRERRVVRA